MNGDIRADVHSTLQSLRGLEPVKKLFWQQLSYDRVNQPLSRDDWPKGANQALSEDPVLFAQAGDFHIFYCRLASDRLRLTDERAVVNRLLREYPYALFVFSNSGQDRWHFVNVKEGAGDAEAAKKRTVRRLLRRIAIGPEERLRTATERISMLDAATIPGDLFGLSPLTLQERHDEAFDVEAVTKAFYKDYKKVFAHLQNELRAQTQDSAWAHDYSLQLLNRLMFLYFVQRKRWLGDDPDFMRSFWQAYKTSGEPENTFFQNWLSVLFFEAFNDRYQDRHEYLSRFPREIHQALAGAPFLNGGLFTRNELDTKHSFTVADAIFRMLFDRFKGHKDPIAQTPGFLERYNFTIREDTPFDQEVAVDPEMIGKVYESLVNITFKGIEEEDLRGTAGIFYTPRVEIDLMCRLSLVDWLANNLGQKHKPLLYELVFAYDPEEKQEADDRATRANLWPELNRLLGELTVLDPACGSGSFLVGMLAVLDDLQERVNRQLGISETPYERRKRIIGQSLYGVDVMPWAVQVAELRLWLQLVVETELKPAELKFRPLLPHLSFKLRPGDSLVQEVGGIDFSRHGVHLDISTALKGQLTRLKGEKLKFYAADPDNPSRFRSEEALKQEELRLFRQILRDRRQAMDKRVQALRRKLNQTQMNLAGEAVQALKPEEARKMDAEIEELEAARAQVAGELGALREPQDMSLVWDIAFVEIFEGEKGGFDIVIGNPPYVRQEKIAPPLERPEAYGGEDSAQWRRLKREYKDKLQRSVALAWPHFFQFRPAPGRFRKLAGRSDYYVYFYLHGLRLLNPKGSFCFITSNSWLDVGYGKDLQEFLLKHGQVKMVIDNEARRSFAESDVNTVIVLLGAPKDTRGDRQESLEHTARFVMLTVPFEQVLDPIIWEEVEETGDRRTTPEYRVHPARQADLLQSGTHPQKGRYTGDKWGGKYLRAPDIYWTILEKGKGKLVRLGDIAEVRFGIKTGANEFFYLDEERIRQWGIEEEFLVPFLFSLKEIERYEVDRRTLERKLFYCDSSKESLSHMGKMGALAYIKWGEGMGFDKRPSVRSRSLWYAVPKQPYPEFVSNRFLGERFGFPWIERTLVGDVFFVGRFEDPDGLLGTTLLNATLSFLSAEVIARKTYGIGVAYLYGPEINGVNLTDPTVLSRSQQQRVVNVFGTMRKRDMLKISDEVDQPDRRALDDIIFDVLGLTQSERDAVYEAVIRLVEARLSKAKSLKGRR